MPKEETFFSSNEPLIPIPDLPLTLDDIHFLHQLVSEYYLASNSPVVKQYSKDLGTGLMQVWAYWSKKTRDTSKFVLHVKK